MLANMLLARHPMDALFDVTMTELCHAPVHALSHEQPHLSATATQYSLEARAPGVKAEDVKMEVTGSVLRIRGETVTKSHTHFVDYTVALPKDADTDNASAEAVDGVLTVVLPKKAVEVKQVAVQSTPPLEHGAEGTSDDDTEQAPHTLTVLAPGVTASEMKIEVKAEEGIFRVTGEPKRAGVPKVLKCFRLPRDADDAEAWHAAHIDGLLTLTIPRKAAPAPTRIEVASAPSSAAAPDKPEADIAMI